MNLVFVIGERQQLNQNTHFLDGSALYGSTLQIANSLRTFSKGSVNYSTCNNIINERPLSLFILQSFQLSKQNVLTIYLLVTYGHWQYIELWPRLRFYFCMKNLFIVASLSVAKSGKEMSKKTTYRNIT